MFDAEALSMLSCSACGIGSLAHSAFEGRDDRRIVEAVVWCTSCRAWFPLQDGVLDLLTGSLTYPKERALFLERHAADIRKIGLVDRSKEEPAALPLQTKQQSHFDWYAANEMQSYLDYEQMPFWQAADAIAFEGWKARMRPGAWLLDVGCGNGRSTFKLKDLDLRILGFDVSMKAVRQAEQRARAGRFAARTYFFTADASRFPLKSAVVDYVLIYGVLHHVPDPRQTCLELARVLKPGGPYFGQENNDTMFRRVFELLQRLTPLWYEEAGPEAVISERSIREAFSTTDLAVRTRTSVFIPPHLVNLLPRWGDSLLRISDWIGQSIPLLNRNGGIILIEGVKRSCMRGRDSPP